MCREAEQTATTGHTTTTKQQDLISQILVDMSQGKYLNLKVLLGISKWKGVVNVKWLMEKDETKEGGEGHKVAVRANLHPRLTTAAQR